ncbi:MAG TPA: hypothetical protein VM689_00375 [Aliidongia sp.]|nr:hypothetical protein [Aliidongia sp.]
MPHIGILTGLRSEARCVSRYVPPGAVTIALSGARAEGARRGAEALVAADTTHLLSFGLAGGLDPRLPPGTLLLPRAILTEDGRTLPVDRLWHEQLLERLEAETDPILGVDTPIASVVAKAALRQRSGAAAIDMESHVLAEAAARAGRPFAAIRVICDAADTALPPAALVGVTEAGGTDLGAILGSILRRPGQLAALLALARAAARAERVLTEAGCVVGVFAT